MNTTNRFTRSFGNVFLQDRDGKFWIQGFQGLVRTDPNRSRSCAFKLAQDTKRRLLARSTAA